MSGLDLSAAVQFDLARGAVSVQTEASMLVPASALAALLSTLPSDQRARLGGDIGTRLGARVEARLGGADAVGRAPMESVVAHLAGEFALAGLGALSMERWGRALVVCIDGAPLADAPELYASLVASAVSRAAGVSAFTTILTSAASLRLLIASPTAAQKVRGWIKDGVPWGDALARLQGGAS